nr:hypothetical protein [Candidatus Sigynarchaeota archaeon]
MQNIDGSGIFDVALDFRARSGDRHSEEPDTGIASNRFFKIARNNRADEHDVNDRRGDLAGCVAIRSLKGGDDALVLDNNHEIRLAMLSRQRNHDLVNFLKPFKRDHVEPRDYISLGTLQKKNESLAKAYEYKSHITKKIALHVESTRSLFRFRVFKHELDVGSFIISHKDIEITLDPAVTDQESMLVLGIAVCVVFFFP